MLRSGEAYFIHTEIPNEANKSDLSQEPLFHSRYVIACRASHPLGKEKQVSLEALSAYPWAMPDLVHSAHDRLAGLFHAQNLPSPVPLLQSTSFSFILRLLETAHALSFVVESSLKFAQQNAITVVDAAVEIPTRRAGSVMRPDSWIYPTTESLIGALHEHCNSNPAQWNMSKQHATALLMQNQLRIKTSCLSVCLAH